jgi:hypothetical protein
VVDDRTVSVSWARGAAQRLHSVVVEYRPDAVLIGTRMGSRPSTSARPPGHVALRMVLEHAVVRLREPLRGRRIEVMTAEPTRRQAQTSAR